MKLPELLSPAGSFESLRAAIAAGADAVYFGVEQLNMRARSARTFTISDIKEVANECKAAGVSCYLTLNTILYDHDIQLARSIIREAKQRGVNAVIACDHAVIELCRKHKMPVHISTQANVTNFESVKYYSTVADVIVLSRELTLKQIKDITTRIAKNKICGPSGQKIKIEVFVHGALCMAVSGKCYLSLHEQNASANRGACQQNCRHAYYVTDAETGNQLLLENEYIMSASDLCTIDLLDEIVAAGVDVLKIEGRTKSAEYVHDVTACYKEALVAIKQKTFTAAKIRHWKERLNRVYNRGFWEGYYLGRPLGKWTHDPGSIATEKKVYIGKATHYYPKLGVAEFLVEAGELKQGDELLILGTKKGAVRSVLKKMRVNGKESTRAGKGDSLTFPLEERTSRSDKLYKTIKAPYE